MASFKALLSNRSTSSFDSTLGPRCAAPRRAPGLLLARCSAWSAHTTDSYALPFVALDAYAYACASVRQNHVGLLLH